MSTQPATATILGQEVEGTIVDELSEGDLGTGPRQIYVLEADGCTYRVDAADVDYR